ncbi:DUF58 domain-containing protein [Sneathiella sp.]|uniref:DUF58 domain-containing protein n=1 Tax=Sneathiella sp. TaxID=1964365 RepID=UPI003568B35D
MWKPRSSHARKLEEKTEAEKLAYMLPSLILAAEHLVHSFDMGVHGRRRAGTGEDFWQFKQYGPDDAATNIDWRQSAKRDHVYIRQKEQETAETVWLWTDTSPTMDYSSDESFTSKLSCATILTLATALLLSKSGEKFGLLGQYEKAATGPVTFNRFAQRLGETAVPRFAGLTATERLSSKSTILLISDFLSPIEDITGVVRQFVDLGCNGFLFHIADPAEVDLPFQGRTKFEGLMQEENLTLGRVETIRQDYQDLFQAHKNRLISFASSVSWEYSFHRTDSAVSEALAKIYTALCVKGA